MKRETHPLSYALLLDSCLQTSLHYKKIVTETRLTEGPKETGHVCLRQRVEAAVCPYRQGAWLTNGDAEMRGGGRGNQREGPLNRRHCSTEQPKWVQTVCQSVTQNHWDRPEALITPFFPPTVSGCGWRGVSLVPGRSWWYFGGQDASGRRALSGGCDEDATLFCGECRVDPKWDKPHVSVEKCCLFKCRSPCGPHLNKPNLNCCRGTVWLLWLEYFFYSC